MEIAQAAICASAFYSTGRERAGRRGSLTPAGVMRRATVLTFLARTGQIRASAVAFFGETTWAHLPRTESQSALAPSRADRFRAKRYRETIWFNIIARASTRLADGRNVTGSAVEGLTLGSLGRRFPENYSGRNLPRDVRVYAYYKRRR